MGAKKERMNCQKVQDAQRKSRVSRVNFPQTLHVAARGFTLFISDQNLYVQYAPPSIVSNSLHESGEHVKLLVHDRFL